MSKRKPLGLRPGIGIALREAVSTPTDGERRAYHSLVPLDQIQIDPNNHRQLEVEPSHLRRDLAENCPPDLTLAEHLAELQPRDVVVDNVALTPQMEEEIQGLLALASTIATAGVVQSLRAYRRGDMHVLVAGERRYLASILAGRPTVPVYVYPDPPSIDEIQLIQFIENKFRQDLSPRDELLALHKIVQTLQTLAGGEPPSLREISSRLGVGKSQASRVRILGGMQDDVRQAIERGDIENIHVAVKIIGEPDAERRAEMIRVASRASSFRAALAALEALEKGSESKKSRPASRGANLGRIPPRTGRRVLEAILTSKEFASLRSVVGELPPEPSARDIEVAWKRLLEAISQDEET